jgi:hypothetical protein
MLSSANNDRHQPRTSLMNKLKSNTISATSTPPQRQRVAWKFAVGAAALAVGAVSVAQATVHASNDVRRLHFIEHEVTSDMIDIGAADFSAGDIFTVHSNILDTTHRQVGRVDIYGVVTEATAAEQSFAGTGMLHLPGGSIAFSSGGFEPEHTLAAITGGTGVYRGAKGEIIVVETDDSPDADITVVLTK